MCPADSTTKASAGLSAAKRALLLRKLQQRIASVGGDVIRRRAEQSKAPLSHVQEQMWFLDQLNPGDPVYNRPSAMRITGAVDHSLLQLSLEAITARHEILRTTFSSKDGIPFQVIHDPTNVSVTHMDLREEPEATREGTAHALMLTEARRVFDLASGPLLRAVLLRLADDQQILLICTHHIVFDGWSERLLRQELAAHYRALATGASPLLPKLAIQYGDYAHWQRQSLQGPSRAAMMHYWRQQLENVQVLDLPTDRPRPPSLPTRAPAKPGSCQGN